MKTTITSLLTALLLTTSSAIVAQENELETIDTVNALLVHGKVLNAAFGENQSCKVEVVDSKGQGYTIALTNGKREFEIRLPKNETFSIKISKDGFLSKRIAINTNVSHQMQNISEFSFNTELISLDDAQGLKNGVLNIPVAFIRWDSLMESFVYDLQYATQMKMDMYAHQSTSKSQSIINQYGH